MNEPQNPEPRPEHIACIRKPKKPDENWSWCGRRLYSHEFALTGLAHAACLQESRLQPCPQCVSNACAELQRLAPESDQPVRIKVKDSTRTGVRISCPTALDIEAIDVDGYNSAQDAGSGIASGVWIEDLALKTAPEAWHCRFCECGGGYTSEATDVQKEQVHREEATHDGCAAFEASEATRKALACRR